MSKWKAPDDFGPGCSIGGRWFDVEDGHVVVGDEVGTDFATPLSALGFVAVPEVEPDPQLPLEAGDEAGDEAGETTPNRRKKRG